MNILITGIHGFVGSNLVEALKDSHTIYGLDIVFPEKPGVKKTFSWNDLQKETFPCVDAIIHLAGKAHDTKNKALDQVYFHVNTELTQVAFDYFLKSSAKKFIFFSSVKAAANSVVGNMLTEAVIPQPVGPYGESKIKAEKYILQKLAESRMQTGDKAVYILRPCMIHGPNNKGNLNLLYKVVSTGIPWPLGAFDNKRSFTSINNLCFVLENLINKDISGGIYHIADDTPLSTNEVINLMADSIHKSGKIWNVNPGFMKFVARMGDVLHLPLNSERLRKLTENYVVSNTKIKQALSIEYMPITAAEGLKQTLESFKRK